MGQILERWQRMVLALLGDEVAEPRKAGAWQLSPRRRAGRRRNGKTFDDGICDFFGEMSRRGPFATDCGEQPGHAVIFAMIDQLRAPACPIGAAGPVIDEWPEARIKIFDRLPRQSGLRQKWRNEDS